jgi:hypothetical protein
MLILIAIPFNRMILDYYETIKLKKEQIKTTLIAGNSNFIQLVKKNINKKITGIKTISVKGNNQLNKEDEKTFSGKLYQIPDLISIYGINEVIFSSQDIDYKDIIHKMDMSTAKHVDYKISLNNELIIGSNSIDKINSN